MTDHTGTTRDGHVSTAGISRGRQADNSFAEGAEVKSEHWRTGKLVMRLRVPEDSTSPDHMLVQPLGITAGGPGVHLVIPGVGQADLRQIDREGATVDFDQIEVTGSRAHEILAEVVSSEPTIEIGSRIRADGIVVVDMGRDVRDDLPGVFHEYADVGRYDFMENFRETLESTYEPLLRMAVCSQHYVPEICPFQH
jgi:hypothetical protein